MNKAAYTHTQEELGEAWEIHQMAYKQDDKGREMGFIRGARKVLASGQCYAWVQAARQGKDKMLVEFGVPQRSKFFPTVKDALAWSYRTAEERIAKMA